MENGWRVYSAIKRLMYEYNAMPDNEDDFTRALLDILDL